MNLSHLSDEQVHDGQLRYRKMETEGTTGGLYHLRENEMRRLYSKKGYPSLKEYAMKELGYTSDEADRRITAMHALRDCPEIQPRVDSGELSLTNLVLAKTLFNKEKKAGREMQKEKKLELLQELTGKSTREAYKMVCEISPEMKKKVPSLDSIEDEVLREKLLRLRGHFAHSHPNMDYYELLHKLADLCLEKIEDEKRPKRTTVRAKAPNIGAPLDVATAAPRLMKSPRPAAMHEPAEPKPGPKPVSKAQIRRDVWASAENKCSNCGSTHALQIDHIRPKAAGGKDNRVNLRLLCRSCNQRAAIEFYGIKKMDRFLNRPQKW